jgi:hypothetical protein
MAKVAKIWDGTAWVDLATSVPDLSNYQLKSEGGLTLVKKQTIGTAVSSVTVSDAFSATYENYKIVVSGGISSTSATNVNLTLGATNSGYYYNGYYLLGYSSSTVLGDKGENISTWIAGFATGNAISMTTELQSPFLTKRTVMNTNAISSTTTGTNFTFNGLLDNATSYTAFTITPSAGTLTGGTIAVYGYNKG